MQTSMELREQSRHFTEVAQRTARVRSKYVLAGFRARFGKARGGDGAGRNLHEEGLGVGSPLPGTVNFIGLCSAFVEKCVSSAVEG